MGFRIALVASVAVMLPMAAPLAAQGPAQAPMDTASDSHRKIVENNDDIQFANYPRGSLKRGEQGIVGINVLTDPQGRIRECAVTRTSGYPELDEASCDLLMAHMKMRPYLAPGGGSVVRRQDGQVVWKLPPGHVAATTTASTDRPITSERKICHVQTRTGSLVGSQRTCLTRMQWLQQTAQAQEELQSMRPAFQSGN